MKSGTIIIGGGASGSTIAKAAHDSAQKIVINTILEEMDAEIPSIFSDYILRPLELFHDIALLSDFNVPKRNPRLRPIPEHRLLQLSNSQNNKSCPCGSGLKYKKCCKK